MPLDSGRFPRKHVKYTLVMENIKLVVSRLFAGDNRLSLDFLLVTTGCHQTKKSSDNRLSADTSILVFSSPNVINLCYF